jgi:hypothetical protein
LICNNTVWKYILPIEMKIFCTYVHAEQSILDRV